MRRVEHVQSAYSGGHPCDNEDGFGHGEPLNVVSKAELEALLERAALLEEVVAAAREAVRKNMHAPACIVNGCIGTPECPMTQLGAALKKLDDSKGATK